MVSTLSINATSLTFLSVAWWRGGYSRGNGCSLWHTVTEFAGELALQPPVRRQITSAVQVPPEGSRREQRARIVVYPYS